MLELFFGGIAGKNIGIIENCNMIVENINTIHLLAKYNNHGTSTAIMNCYIGSLVGQNDSSIKSCNAEKSEFIKDVGKTSLKESNLNTYGVVCELNLYEDEMYAGIIGKNGASVENVIYN